MVTELQNKSRPVPSASRPSRNHRKRILIVEDEIPLLTLLSDTFTSEKFKVFKAKNGKEGLDTAFRERPDLILLDLLIPEINGLMVLKRLRRDKYKWGKYVPVIILSNLSDVHTIAQAKTNRADDYLVKADWSLNELVKKVKEKLHME